MTDDAWCAAIVGWSLPPYAQKVLFDRMCSTWYQSLQRSQAVNLTITEPFAGNVLQP
jgi:hypothetical protein